MSLPPISFAAAVQNGTFVLAEAAVPSPRPDASALACHVVGVEHPFQAPPRLSGEQFEQYLTLIGRRAAREPLQHLTGKMYFRRLTLAARPGVFICRPETEMVVEEALSCLKHLVHSNPGPFVVADLGCGSGAIAVSLATEGAALLAGHDPFAPAPAPTFHEHLTVLAADINPLALQLTAQNAAKNGARVQTLEADVAAFGWREDGGESGAEGRAPGSVATEGHAPGSAGTALENWTGRVDLVCTNPPYVVEQVVQPEAQADPPEALYGLGEGGLDLPRAFLAAARRLLRPGGYLVMEHAESQATALRQAAAAAGFSEPTTGTDLTGRARYLRAQAC